MRNPNTEKIFLDIENVDCFPMFGPGKKKQGFSPIPSPPHSTHMYTHRNTWKLPGFGGIINHFLLPITSLAQELDK